MSSAFQKTSDVMLLKPAQRDFWNTLASYWQESACSRNEAQRAEQDKADADFLEEPPPIAGRAHPQFPTAYDHEQTDDPSSQVFTRITEARSQQAGQQKQR
jgi:hypothetical protein